MIVLQKLILDSNDINSDKNPSFRWDLNPQPLWSSQTLQPLSFWRLYGEHGWNVGLWLEPHLAATQSNNDFKTHEVITALCSHVKAYQPPSKVRITKNITVKNCCLAELSKWKRTFISTMHNIQSTMYKHVVHTCNTKEINLYSYTCMSVRAPCDKSVYVANLKNLLLVNQ